MTDNNCMKYNDDELLKQIRKMILRRIELRYAVSDAERIRRQEDYEERCRKEAERHHLSESEQDIQTWMETLDLEDYEDDDIESAFAGVPSSLAVEHYVTPVPIADIYIAVLNTKDEEGYINFPELYKDEISWTHLEVYLREEDVPFSK